MIGVFGANGFIGKHLIRSLAKQERSVRAVARAFDGPAPRNIDQRITDFRIPEAVEAALSGVNTVIQLISTSSPAHGNSQTLLDIQENVLPHVVFLQKCVDLGIRRYIFLSSGGTVYGPVSGSKPIPESAPTNPICSHGLTKLMIEKFIGMHGLVDGLDYVVLRPSNPFGPGQIFRNGQGLIPALLARHRQGLPVTIYGNGTATRDYIYIDDLVEAITAAIDADSPQNAIINIGSGRRRSILEVVRAIESAAGIRFEIQNAPERPTDIHDISLDIRRAKKVLGWEPHTEFMIGLSKTLLGQIMDLSDPA